MKVAIIGAGVSGLACALELERQGIQPTIFEEKHRIGSPSPFAPVLLNYLYRPMKDIVAELRQHYGIDLKPISPIRFLRVQGPHSQYTVGGNLGYTLLRGQNKNSLESQLAAQLKTPIRFESPVQPKDIIKGFDYLVVADGHKDYAKTLGIWHGTYRAWIRGATILGRFNPEEVRFWFHQRYAKSGYAYMAPMGRESASLILNVSYGSQDKLPKYWQAFLEQEYINPEEVMHWDIDYECGLVYPHRVGNTFFVGNSGGLVTSWLSSGILPCIVSGVEAARAIGGGEHYERNIKPWHRIMERQARIRHLWDGFNNRSIDWAIRLMGSPPIKHPLYHTNLNLLGAVDPLIKFWVDKIPEDQSPIH